MVSKCQIMFESKASRELKTERTRQYVSISIRGTTQSWALRRIFEMDFLELFEGSIIPENPANIFFGFLVRRNSFITVDRCGSGVVSCQG